MASYTDANAVLSSPLKQFKSGVLPQDVKCKDGFVLIIKVNGEPTCAKPTNISRLLINGWVTLEKFEIIHQIVQQNATSSLDQNQNTTDQSTMNYTQSNMISNQTYANPLDVMHVINNLDSLYGKHIVVSGYWYDKFGGLPEPHCRVINPNIKPTYDNSTYVVNLWGGNNYLTTAKPSTIDTLLVSLPNNQYLFNDQDPVKHRGEFVVVSGILKKYYTNGCTGDHYYKSAILQVNPNRNVTNYSINETTTDGFGSSTISPSLIYKWYQDRMTHDVPQIAPYPIGKPLPALQVIPTVSSTNPNSIRILLIGMSPNPLKIGDMPDFTLTYQNISDKPFFHIVGCQQSAVNLTILPTDNVVVNPLTYHCMGDVGTGPIYPNQITTETAWLHNYYGTYKITKSGVLHVTMDLSLGLHDHPPLGKYDLNETIQFDVNATQ